MKSMYHLETIAAIGLKVGFNIQINELIKLNEHQSQGHYMTLSKRHSDFEIKSCFSEKLTKFHIKAEVCVYVFQLL